MFYFAGCIKNFRWNPNKPSCYGSFQLLLSCTGRIKNPRENYRLASARFSRFIKRHLKYMKCETNRFSGVYYSVKYSRESFQEKKSEIL